MTQLNPLANAILTSTVTQTQSADAKRRQIRQQQLTRSNAATREDSFEPHVESSDELHATDDREKKGSGNNHSQKRKNPGHDSEDPNEQAHIDLCG